MIIFGLSGLAFHAILLNIVPKWEIVMKGIAVIFPMMPAVVMPFFVLMLFFPFAPLTALVVFAVLIGMALYAVYYVIDVVF